MWFAEAQDPFRVSMEGLVWQHSRATFTVDHCWSNVWTRYRWSRSSVSGQWLWVKIEDFRTPQNCWALLDFLTQSHGKDFRVYRMFRCKSMWHMRRVSLQKQLRSWKSFVFEHSHGSISWTNWQIECYLFIFSITFNNELRFGSFDFGHHHFAGNGPVDRLRSVHVHTADCDNNIAVRDTQDVKDLLWRTALSRHS